MTERDGSALEAAVLRAAPATRPMTVLEVGICHGDTARGIQRFCAKNGILVAYHGVDSGKDTGSVTPPFEGATVYQGDSAEIYEQVAPGVVFDLVFLDGCHCINHVMLDVLHYGPRLRPGGELVLHDVAARGQRKGDYQGHGPQTLDFGTATLAALSKLGLYPWCPASTGWALIDYVDDGQDWGGVLVYRRTA